MSGQCGFTRPPPIVSGLSDSQPLGLAAKKEDLAFFCQGHEKAIFPQKQSLDWDRRVFGVHLEWTPEQAKQCTMLPACLQMKGDIWWAGGTRRDRRLAYWALSLILLAPLRCPLPTRPLATRPKIRVPRAFLEICALADFSQTGYWGWPWLTPSLRVNLPRLFRSPHVSYFCLPNLKTTDPTPTLTTSSFRPSNAMDVGHVFPPANGAHGTHGVNGVNGSAVTTTPNEDPAMERLPDIPPMSRIWGHHRFDLAIQQQPQRARMCGFGDKVS